MAESPLTGERPSGFRRSSSQFATIPHRSLSFHEKVGLAKDDAAANVLYTHPSVRVYTFQPPTDALKSLDTTKKTLPDADYPIDAIEILPWRAKTETLAARGKLIIEKVQGSVHFLKAGELIHTIMKNSQCWCVDGESKFVMRVGRLRYQRIEMPSAEPEEKEKVEEFKEVVSKILKFEKTPCPFIRAFQVDLPDDAITPRRRGTWKRKESLNSLPAEDEPRPLRRTKTGRTMSMRGVPPNAFPSRSLTQLDMDRPRTASTPHSTGRFSFPDVTIESPTTYTSGDENTDSDRHDSESDRPETGHSSEVDESDKESSNFPVPVPRSPLNIVQTLSSTADQDSVDAHYTQNTTSSEPASSLDSYHIRASTATTLQLPNLKTSAQKIKPSPRATLDNVVPNDDANHASVPDVPEESPNIEGPSILSSDTHEIEPLVTLTYPSSVAEELPVNHAIEHELVLDLQGDEVSPNVSLEGLPHGLADGSIAEADDRPAVPTSTAESRSPTQVIPESAQTDADAFTHTRESEPGPALDSLTQSRTNEDAESTVSGDSFHTFFSDDDTASVHGTSLGTRPFKHRRELSDVTVTADSIRNLDQVLLQEVDSALEPMPDLKQTEQAGQDAPWRMMRTPGAFTDELEIRRNFQHRHSLSPSPPASILQTNNQVERSSPIPAALLQKAASLAVVKPLEVFVFIVQILARIAGGATMNDLVSGNLFRNPSVRRTASGNFEQDTRGRSSGRESEEEDDYGVPVHGVKKSSSKVEEADLRLNHEIDDAASYASID